MGKLVYVAEPIDQTRGTEGRILRSAAAEVLSLVPNCTTFRPSRAFQSGAAATEIQLINQTALRSAAAVVAILPAGVPTLGVPAEIEQALARHVPVFILTNKALVGRSVQLQAWAERGAVLWTPSGAIDPYVCREWSADLWEATERSLPGSHYAIQVAAGATLPSRAYSDDAGLDLAITQDATVLVGDRALLPTGVAGALPPGTWGLIMGRSSTWAKRGLMVIPSVIDAGWRGELLVGVWNPPHMQGGQGAVELKAGERIAQIVLLPAWQGAVMEVDRLPGHQRGLNGFGSSDGQSVSVSSGR